jgi:diguanylate cyclase
VNYQHSLERSAEYLRAALPLMSRYSTRLHPVSYAVWYDYVCGEHPELKNEIDGRLARNGMLDDATTMALFRRHIAEMDEDAARQFTEGMTRVLSGVEASVHLAGQQSANFDRSLQHVGHQLESSTVPVDAIASLQSSTREMQNALAQLQHKLNESQREIQNLREEVRRTRQESQTDSLSGLHNRRAFDHRTQEWLEKLRSPDAPAVPSCIILADIDHFKKVNDTYGHAFGDQVIRGVAEVLRQLTPEQATAARIGGEEFALLLPHMDRPTPQGLAERVRTRIAAIKVRRQGDERALGGFTISLGVAPCRAGDSVMTAMERADQALYRSKQEGRDRVTLVQG